MACLLTLTAASPSGACPTPSAGARLADVTVSVLANPRSAQVNVAIAFRAAAGPVVRLAPVSLYPLNQPMRARMRLPHGRGQLVFTLVGGEGPLAVRVGPIAWLQSEP